MNDKGRMRDVIVEDMMVIDWATGLDIPLKNTLVVWADADKINTIRGVDGVCAVHQDIVQKTMFEVRLDPRYDHEFVKREIEAAVLCSEDERDSP